MMVMSTNKFLLTFLLLEAFPPGYLRFYLILVIVGGGKKKENHCFPMVTENHKEKKQWRKCGGILTKTKGYFSF